MANRSESELSLPPRGGIVASASLPVALTTLVGRQREIAVALGLLRRPDVRLLTLTGAGGIGKTRLSVEIARTVTANDFPDGVRFVALAAVTEASLVPVSILAALGVPDQGALTAEESLALVLGGTSVLLVLDNFEHVVAAAPLLITLLEACQRLKILVTSRILLRVTGEHALPVPPLTLDDAEVAASRMSTAATPLERAEAVTLFAERARAVNPAFALTDTTEPIVTEICRHLDGLPLAIELAAARTSHLPLPLLRARLERRLPLLTGGPRDAPLRLRTMHDAIGWSYGLLPAESQTLFQRLAVFRGGFALDAAEQVAGGDHGGNGKRPEPLVDTPSVLERIAGLVEASLLQSEPGADGAARFRMLETVREFAGERLAEHGEEEAVRQAHAVYYLGLAERSDYAPFLPAAPTVLAHLDAEQANLRAALAWFEESGRIEESARAVGALGMYWFVRGYLPGVMPWIEQVMARGDGLSPSVRVRAGIVLAMAMLARRDLERVRSLAQGALSLARETGNRLGAAQALTVLGVWATGHGDYAQSAAFLREAIEGARMLDDRKQSLGMASSALSNLGVALRGLGRIDEAAALHEEALAGQRAVGSIRGEVNALGDLADVALEKGDYTTTLTRGREALRLAWMFGEQRAIAGMLEGVACAAAGLGRAEQAARIFAASAHLRESSGIGDWLPLNLEACERGIATARAQLGEEQFVVAWATGRTLPLADAVAEALDPADPADDRGAAARVTITSRESEILEQLVAGKTDREIAEALYISVRTVEAHVSRLLAKLGVRTRTAAVGAAISAGLVEPDQTASVSPILPSSPDYGTRD